MKLSFWSLLILSLGVVALPQDTQQDTSQDPPQDITTDQDFVKPAAQGALPNFTVATIPIDEVKLNPLEFCTAITIACNLCLIEFAGAILFCEAFAPGCSFCVTLGFPCECLLPFDNKADPNTHVDAAAPNPGAVSSLVESVSASLAFAGAVTGPTGLPINDGDPSKGVKPGD